MDYLNFDVQRSLHLNWTGKFIAPDENWIHMSRVLTDFEFIVMTEGELFIADDRGQYHLQKGDYRIMSPCERQYGYKPSQCTFYWTHFSYNNFHNDPGRHKEGELHLPFPAEDTHIALPEQARVPRLDRLVVQFKQLQDCNRKYRNINQDGHILTSILCELYSQLYLSGSRVTMKGEQVQLYTDIVDYISWRIRENIRVSEIAEYFGYNEKYITTFFKKSAGLSLKAYILNQKMELAQALLTDTNLPIAQIGYDIGFSDNHNFSSAFKKITGQSPSEYRNSYAERMLFHE
ncbi:MAG: helix-turn-helix transcriptional regulator [Eubacterium sp.]|nr:helix-turn-helix transcriptional regulator [Eubacterium sp.]